MRYKKTLAVGYVLLIFIVGLWPFEIFSFFSTNKLNWIRQDTGITMESNAYLTSVTPPSKLPLSFKDQTEFTLEVYLMSGSNRQKGPARIVSYSFNTVLRNFTLGQHGNSLIFRLRTVYTDDNGVDPSFKAETVFTPGNRQHIIFTYDGRNEKLYVNGILKAADDKVFGKFSNWDTAHSLTIGNELTGDRPWNGNIYFLALYDHAIDGNLIYKFYSNIGNDGKDVHLSERLNNGLVGLYLFNEGQGDYVYDKSAMKKAGDLKVTKIPVKRFRIGSMWSTESQSIDYMDIFVNIAGFFPLSLIFFACLKNKKGVFFSIYILPLLLGISLSISVEFMQKFSLSRHPNIVDIIYNFIGILVGSIVLHLYLASTKKLLVHPGNEYL